MVPTVIIHKPYKITLVFISNTKNYHTIPVTCDNTLTSTADDISSFSSCNSMLGFADLAYKKTALCITTGFQQS